MSPKMRIFDRPKTKKRRSTPCLCSKSTKCFKSLPRSALKRGCDYLWCEGKVWFRPCRQECELFIGQKQKNAEHRCKSGQNWRVTTFRPKARCDFGRVAKTLAPKSADRGLERGGLIFDKNRSNLEVNRAGEQNYTDIMKFSKNILGVDVPIAQITSRTRLTNWPDR